MKRYYIIERMACVVTWRFPVDAESTEEAFEKYGNAEHGEAEPPVIGDSLDDIQYDLDIEEDTSDQTPTTDL